MSAPGHDSEAVALLQRPLATDTAHLFRNRTILTVSGDLSGLRQIAITSSPTFESGGYFACLLDEEQYLGADFFVVPVDDGYLIDTHSENAVEIAERIQMLPGVETPQIPAVSQWRVLGELPSQKGGESQFRTIRFADSRRRELGIRILRDTAEPEGLDWRHSRKWDIHAMKLGILPDHRCVLGKRIKPEEAGFHRLGGGMWPDERCCYPIETRVLPVRIEPTSETLPLMAGLPILAEGEEVGTMLDQEGLFGIALVHLGPWRSAIEKTLQVTCASEPVLITWPTWLSSDSEGRRGPAGDLI